MHAPQAVLFFSSPPDRSGNQTDKQKKGSEKNTFSLSISLSLPNYHGIEKMGTSTWQAESAVTVAVWTPSTAVHCSGTPEEVQ
jgi:hypothetical protein